MAERGPFAEFARARRLALGVTLRQFCREHGFDVGNMSRIERGRAAPTQTDGFLGRYATALKLEPRTDQWRQFHDLARIAAGRIPERILNDEELVAKLPIVFRTLSEGGPLTEEKLLDLAERIRRA